MTLKSVQQPKLENSMSNERAKSVFAVRQSATFRMRIGRHGGMSAKVVVTPAGLLAIGGLVSAILLSIPPIIRAAGDAKKAADRG